MPPFLFLLLLDDVDDNKSMCIVYDAQSIVFKLKNGYVLMIKL